MINPILQILNGSKQNNLLQTIQMIKSTINNGNPNTVFNSLMQTNPQFKEFVTANENKSPEEIANEYGIDFNLIKRYL